MIRHGPDLGPDLPGLKDAGGTFDCVLFSFGSPEDEFWLVALDTSIAPAVGTNRCTILFGLSSLSCTKRNISKTHY